MSLVARRSAIIHWHDEVCGVACRLACSLTCEAAHVSGGVWHNLTQAIYFPREIPFQSVSMKRWFLANYRLAWNRWEPSVHAKKSYRLRNVRTSWPRSGSSVATKLQLRKIQAWLWMWFLARSPWSTARRVGKKSIQVGPTNLSVCSVGPS